METLLQQTSFDCVERFLYQHQQQTDLPVLGNSALDQILQQPKQFSLQHQLLQEDHRFASLDMERMSPDSSMDWTLHGCKALPLSSSSACSSSSSAIVTQPDSTTREIAYDSDAFNSDDSNESFVELQLNPNLLADLQMHNSREDSSSSSSNSSSPPPSSASLHEDFDFSNNNFAKFAPSSPCSSRSSLDEKQADDQQLLSKRRKKKTKRAGDVTLTCDQCPYTTRFKEHLTSHMNTHLEFRKYMCTECGQTFKWSHCMKRHQRKHQKGNFRYSCSQCPKQFSRKDHLTIHENLHKPPVESFPCPDCGAAFKNKKTLAGHRKTHAGQKAFRCDQCSSEFTRRASLTRHVQVSHAGQVIKCPDCDALFSYKSTLEDHKKAAHNQGKREFECELCHVQFAVKAYLSKHMNTCRNRADGLSFACTICLKSFPTKRHLSEHSKRKHSDNKATAVMPKEEAVEQKPHFDEQLHYQDYPFHQHQQHQHQQQQHHSQLLPLPSFQQYPSSCPTCDLCHASFPSEHDLDAHLLGHLPTQTSSSVVTSAPEVVTGSDLTLSQVQHQQESGGEETVGSLLRLVYSCADPSSTGQDCRGMEHLYQGHMGGGDLGRNPMYQDRGAQQSDELIDYLTMPIDCL